MAFGHGIELDAVERSAIAIVFSELEGNKFDWDLMRFKDEE